MPKKIDSGVAWGAAKEYKQIIISSAIKCFEQYGPQRTSMDDIAKTAGISRKTLYRVFEDRPRLIQAVLQKRLVNIVAKVQAKVAKAVSFEEALLEGSVVAVSFVLKDKLITDIILNETDHTLEQFLIHGNKRIYETNMNLWKIAIDKGRQDGVVKAGLSDDRIIEIMASIHALAVMRNEGPAKQRAFLKDVLVPALVCPTQI